MSTKPRTPAYFPRMKDRAAGRAIRKRRRATVEYEISFDKVERAVDAIVHAARHASNAMVKVGVAFDGLASVMRAMELAAVQNRRNV